jgi:DNA-binding transcriptional MerR regulator
VKLGDLVARTGENARQIRYLISEGIVPRPEGRTSDATYGERHVEAIRAYQELRRSGIRPAEAKRMMSRVQPLDISFSPGVRLILDPFHADWRSPDPEKLAFWVQEQVKLWVERQEKFYLEKETTHAS